MRISTAMLTTVSVVALVFCGLGSALAQQPPGGPPPGAGAPPAGAPPGDAAPDAGAPAAGGPPPGGGFSPPGAGLTLADIVIDRGAPSTSRGAPLPVPDAKQTNVGPLFGTGDGNGPPRPALPPIFGARDGDVPAGITPLDHDIFTSTDFYADKDLWMDQRYYRCAAPQMMELLWQGQFQTRETGINPAIGTDAPRTIAWGKCDTDYPRENMVSPYSFKTAQEQYEALLAEAKSRGGPTVHTRADLPDWDGQYFREGYGTDGEAPGREINWHSAAIQQTPTYLSLLTPEYQQRMVQQLYHDAHNHSLYPGSFCWPEGYMRQYFTPVTNLLLTPEVAQIWTNTSEQIWTPAYIGRDFDLTGSAPNLSGDLRQWYGDSIGFWDGNVLVTWTSNIHHWFSHGWFEYSDSLQTINIYSQINDKDGKFLGIDHEAILYDPEAFVQPLRIINDWIRVGALNQGRVFRWAECLPTYYPLNGEQTSVTPGQTIEYTIPDLNGRPWADIWEANFEKDMAAKPKQNDVLSGFN